ncbi:MAG: Gmad2 immunoglobulin-like domain-containing protein [Candidatus Pacebacteria bacterium]|nr:Gmad2 immunoglobulin-like domain-containing protein [Candidatus Paceibacterota bacterium]
MNKTGWTLAIISILIIVAAIILFVLPGTGRAPTVEAPATTTPVVVDENPSFGDMIVVESLDNNDTITSPLTITGKARGGWYFEASFPIEIQNASGTKIAEGPAQAQGEWMTENYVPFSATLTFPAQPAGSVGKLILHKDNPSGLPENDAMLEMPVSF